MTRLKYELNGTRCITPCPFGMTVTYEGKTLIRKVGNCLECETCEYYIRYDNKTHEVMCNHPDGQKTKYEIAQEILEEYRDEYPTESFPMWLEKKIGKRNLKALKSMNELITGDISLSNIVITDDINNPETYKALDNISLEVALDLIKQEKLWYYEKETE